MAAVAVDESVMTAVDAVEPAVNVIPAAGELVTLKMVAVLS